jgi:TolA-binding protein
MKIRPLLMLTALVSSILGAVVVYLVLSVPNDLRADALMKEARTHIQDGSNDKARDSLKKIMQQYPRTDAAAAAAVALDSLAQKERDDLARAVSVLRKQNDEQTQRLDALQQNITELRTQPAKTVSVTAPATPAPAAKAAPKKATPKKKTTTKRSTRRRR